MRAIAWTLWSVATIFLSGRLIARSTLAGFQLGYDDWTILLSYVVLTAVTIGAELSMPRRIRSHLCIVLMRGSGCIRSRHRHVDTR